MDGLFGRRDVRNQVLNKWRESSEQKFSLLSLSLSMFSFSLLSLTMFSFSLLSLTMFSFSLSRNDFFRRRRGKVVP